MATTIKVLLTGQSKAEMSLDLEIRKVRIIILVWIKLKPHDVTFTVGSSSHTFSLLHHGMTWASGTAVAV